MAPTLKPNDRVCVERIAADRWHVWPMDETWIRALSAGAQRGPGGSAVIKEHPQHDGVLLQGDLSTLQMSAVLLRQRLLLLAEAPLPLMAPDYATAILLKRAIETRPVCMAATRVSFTNEVACCEAEPLAAHRLGLLGFCCDSPRAAEAMLMALPGQEATASGLVLPDWLTLSPGFENTPLGIKAKATGGSALLCVGHVQLEANNVFHGKHAKFMGVSIVSYWPEVRLAEPVLPETLATMQAARLSIASDGVVSSAHFPVRMEFVADVAPGCLLAPPRHVRLDFEPISFHTKAAVVREACQCLVSELDEVIPQLSQAEPLGPARL